MGGSPITGDALSENLPGVINALGEPDFGSNLLRLLHGLAGVEHIAVYAMGSGDLIGVTTASIDGLDHRDVMDYYIRRSLWRADPTFSIATKSLKRVDHAFVRSNLPEITDATLKNGIYRANNIRDRALVCKKAVSGTLGMTLCSSRTNYFENQRLGELEAPLETIFALLARHCELVRAEGRTVSNIGSLRNIEQHLEVIVPELAPRERQVCSRIIDGASTGEIANDLGISIETVTTYRKRAYLRLKVSSQRELLLWYMQFIARRRAIAGN